MKVVGYAVLALLLATPAIAASDHKPSPFMARIAKVTGVLRLADSCDQPPDGVCPEGLCYNASCPVNAPCLRPGMAPKMKFCRAAQ